MSAITDNIMLALVSLKEDLEDYLEDQGWIGTRVNTTIVVAGDPKYKNKEMVREVEDTRKQIGLPAITLEADDIRNDVIELGNSSGKDYVVITLLVRALDFQQLLTLGNLVRRKLTDYILTVYDYTKTKKEEVGTVGLTDTRISDISDHEAVGTIDEYMYMINTTMEIDFDSFI